MVCGFGPGIARQGCPRYHSDGARQSRQRKIRREGVLEYKIDFGPGYRVYFARDGETLLILLTGGTKKRQQRDINTAITYWQDYKRGKRGIR
jgi:putative addiction module killer protein